jgi:hypothetical protein
MMLGQGMLQGHGSRLEERHKDHPVLLHEEDIFNTSNSRFPASLSLSISCPPRHLSRSSVTPSYLLHPAHQSR